MSVCKNHKYNKAIRTRVRKQMKFDMIVLNDSPLVNPSDNDHGVFTELYKIFSNLFYL